MTSNSESAQKLPELRHDQRLIVFVKNDDDSTLRPVKRPSQSIIKNVVLRKLREPTIGASSTASSSFNGSPNAQQHSHQVGNIILPSITTAISPKECCKISVLRFIRLIDTADWKFSAGKKVLNELNSGSADIIAEDIVSGWVGKAAELVVLRPSWADYGSAMLPKAASYKKLPELYLDFLQVASIVEQPAHTKAYGGMASGVFGLYDRIRNHESQNFRDSHPSFHYNIKNMSGTKSSFQTAEQARDAKANLKAMELVTCNFPVSIMLRALTGRQKTGQMKFDLLHGQTINITSDWQNAHPELYHHNHAIAYIAICANGTHDAPCYNHVTDKHDLKKFGIR